MADTKVVSCYNVVSLQSEHLHKAELQPTGTAFRAESYATRPAAPFDREQHLHMHGLREREVENEKQKKIKALNLPIPTLVNG